MNTPEEFLTSASDRHDSDGEFRNSSGGEGGTWASPLARLGRSCPSSIVHSPCSSGARSFRCISGSAWSPGLYIFVVCATGAALVFRIDMQRALHPDLFTPSAEGPPADPVAIMDSVTRAYPGEKLSGIDAPTTARPTYLAYTSSGDRFRTLLLDPGDRDDARRARRTRPSSERSRICTSICSGGQNRPHRQRHRRRDPGAHVRDGPGHLVARTQQLAAKSCRRCPPELEAHQLGSAQRRRLLDGRARADVGGDRRLLRVSIRISIDGQLAVADHESRRRRNRAHANGRAAALRGARSSTRRSAMHRGSTWRASSCPRSEKAAFLVQFSPVRPTPLGADLSVRVSRSGTRAPC